MKVMAFVIIVSKSALCVGRCSPVRCVKAMAPVGFPSFQPLCPEWTQLAPWRGPVDSAERPMNTLTSPPSCWSANQHWHSHSLSMPFSVNLHFPFDRHLIELKICLDQPGASLQRTAVPLMKPQPSCFLYTKVCF